MSTPAWTPDSPPDPPQPQPGAVTPPAREIARGPRPGTVVWGLIVVAVGILSIVAATGVDLDLELTAIVGLAAAGVLLLVTAVVSSARHRNRD